MSGKHAGPAQHNLVDQSTSDDKKESRCSYQGASGAPGDWEFDDEFDGGEETCGRVIVNLHLYTRDQPPGTRILVISRDPAAPLEFPAWCRLTKNELTSELHPYYLITLKPHLIRR